MKSLKLSLFAAVGALFFVSYSATAQQAATTKKAATKLDAKAPAKLETKSPAAAQVIKAAGTPAAEGQNMKPSDITWTEDVHNFGDIEKSKPVSHDFTFKNTTKQTILVTNVKASCGCTATNYTKTPIKPGETGSVTATYNAANPGPFTKTVTVTTNDSDVKKILTIKGKVEGGAAVPVATPQN
mgnify:CR=1 FL=1